MRFATVALAFLGALLPFAAFADAADEVLNPLICLKAKRVVDIPFANPRTDKALHDRMIERIRTEIGRPNTLIRLGPDVELDFSEITNLNQPLLQASRCVTLRAMTPLEWKAVSGQTRRETARSASNPGPLMKYGPIRPQARRLIGIRCYVDGTDSDYVSISGFRIHGPSFGQQDSIEDGILVDRCVGVTISNMEIGGFANAAIQIFDGAPQRITSASQVKVLNSYIHSNQHPQNDNDHAAGYGVSVGPGAWAQISNNVFDNNRHAIAANGASEGYVATGNLVLKGGGVHGTWYNGRTHQFDVHGTGDHGLGGKAGKHFVFARNAFQFRIDHAIKVRGTPTQAEPPTLFEQNVFPHPGLESDWGDDAIAFHSGSTNMRIGSGNRINIDTYGIYGVCDFDGDAIDDLFLATGESWWFSGHGEFAWTFLAERKEMLSQVRLGYFDADLRCDVLTESGGRWLISSGGTGPWTSIGSYGVPLAQVAFGRFDPTIRDPRPGVTRRTTHAFRRDVHGNWRTTTLNGPAWRTINNSVHVFSNLRFADVTGDGVTDVIAVVGGRWKFSRSGHGPWETLNATLGNAVSTLRFTDLNHDNIDDILRFDVQVVGPRTTQTWWVSDNGRSAWRRLVQHVDTINKRPPTFGYAGRFGVNAGGAVMSSGTNRRGRFYGPIEGPGRTPANWLSVFPY